MMTRTGSQQSQNLHDTRTECLERELRCERGESDDLFLFPQPMSKQRSKELLWANYGLKAKKPRPKSTGGGPRGCGPAAAAAFDESGAPAVGRGQREKEARFWSSAVAMEEAWADDRDTLVKENQMIGRRLDATTQRIKHLEDELRNKAAKVKKAMGIIDDRSNRLLYMHLTDAMNELRSKQVQWGKDKQALEDLFKREIRAMEASFDRDRRDILLERDALFRDKQAVTKKLRYAEQAIADMELHLETADHEVQDKKEVLLRNLKDFEKKFTQVPLDVSEMSRSQLVDKQDEVLLQLLVAKITVHQIAAGREAS